MTSPLVKKILPKIFLSLAGICAGIIISMVLVSWYFEKTASGRRCRYIQEKLARDRSEGIGCFDKGLGWGFKPGAQVRTTTSEFDVTYVVNSHGLRSREVPFEKPVQKFRILSLGESTLFGEGVKTQERATGIIEKALPNTEIINMGVRGYGFDQSLLQLRRDGFQYHPDLVVIFVLLDDYLERCKDGIRDSALKPRFVLDKNKEKIVLEDLNSVRKKFHPVSVSEPQEGKSQGAAEKDKEHWDRVYKTLEEEEKSRKEYPEEDFRKLIFLLLKNYKEACREHNAHLLVVLGLLDHKHDWFGSFCRDLNIPCVDLSVILGQASKFKRLRFEIDPHYNSFAHRIIGEYVASDLEKRYHLDKNKDFNDQYLGRF
jgi:hypothetical protein